MAFLVLATVPPGEAPWLSPTLGRAPFTVFTVTTYITHAFCNIYAATGTQMRSKKYFLGFSFFLKLFPSYSLSQVLFFFDCYFEQVEGNEEVLFYLRKRNDDESISFGTARGDDCCFVSKKGVFH